MFWRAILSVLLLVSLTRCATYASRVRDARMYYEMEQYDRAVIELQALAKKEDNDRLLYLMDLGIVYFAAKRYDEAIKVFTQADELAKITDYTRLSEEAASILISNNVKFYKGEDFEKILINVYLAMCFTLKGDWSGALVEARRVNHKIGQMIQKGKLPYKRNAFAKYLAGTLFEAQREYNDAFVDYRQLKGWGVNFPYLGRSLLRMADKLKTEQEYFQYKKAYPNEKNFRLKKTEGEIILLVEEGKAPIKVPSREWQRLPAFRKRTTLADHVLMRVGASTEKTHTLFDIENTAMRQLEHRRGLILAKKIGGIVLKEVVAHQVAKQTKSEALGFLTSVVLHAADQPDLRSWTLLPARLQIARMTVPAGLHVVDLDMVTIYGKTRKGVKRFEKVEVKPGQRVFLSYRTKE